MISVLLYLQLIPNIPFDYTFRTLLHVFRITIQSC